MKTVYEITAEVLLETLLKVEANGGFIESREKRLHNFSKQSILAPADDVASTAVERSRRPNAPAKE